MSWRAKVAASFVGLLLLFVAPSTSYASGYQTDGNLGLQSQPDCAEVLVTALEEGDLMGDLVNPVLNTQAEIEEKIALYKRVYPCIDELGIVFSQEDLELIDMLVLRFLYLVEGEGQQIDLVDLETSDDPAVSRLRDEIGVPPPDGYIFVNHIDSRYEIPTYVTDAFLDPDVRGVALPFRFVIVLEESDTVFDDLGMEEKSRSKTISHELVHAYLEAKLDLEDDLPTWFHEGLATNLSGGAKTQTISLMIPGLSAEIVRTAPEDYLTYDTVFRYLESELSEEGFNKVVREAIENNSVEGIFLATGFADFDELLVTAEKWGETHEPPKDATELDLDEVAIPVEPNDEPNTELPDNWKDFLITVGVWVGVPISLVIICGVILAIIRGEPLF